MFFKKKIGRTAVPPCYYSRTAPARRGIVGERTLLNRKEIPAKLTLGGCTQKGSGSLTFYSSCSNKFYMQDLNAFALRYYIKWY
jgi:hypothetical protein